MFVPRLLLGFAVVFPIACGSAKSPPPAVPSTSPDALSETRQRYPRFGADLATTWPGAGGFDDVVVAIGNAGHGWSMIVYRRSVATAETDLRPAGIGPRPTAIATIDVTHDGRPDLLVFMPSAERPGSREVQTVNVYSAWEGLTGDAKPANREVALLDGCRDLDAVRERMTRPMALAEMMSAGTRESVTTRLFYTTPERFREAVAPAGLRLCQVDHDAAGKRHESCRTLAPAEITARLYTEQITPFATQLLDKLTMACEPSPGPCGSGDAAGNELEVFFTGEGTARRVSAITTLRNVPRTDHSAD